MQPALGQKTCSRHLLLFSLISLVVPYPSLFFRSPRRRHVLSRVSLSGRFAFDFRTAILC